MQCTLRYITSFKVHTCTLDMYELGTIVHRAHLFMYIYIKSFTVHTFTCYTCEDVQSYTHHIQRLHVFQQNIFFHMKTRKIWALSKCISGVWMNIRGNLKCENMKNNNLCSLPLCLKEIRTISILILIHQFFFQKVVKYVCHTFFGLTIFHYLALQYMACFNNSQNSFINVG